MPADLALRERGHRERDREVGLAGARRPDPEGDGALADRVDVVLLRHRLRRDPLAAMAPDDVVEDLADVLGLVERAEDRVDRAGADLVAALDELDELVDDRARLRDLPSLAVDRQAVAAQVDLAVEPLAQRVEDAVADASELGSDLVRDVEDFLHGSQCRSRTVRSGPGGRQRAYGELLAHDLAHARAVGAARDLRHHVGHHAAEVGHARGADLCDRVVDDLLDLVLGERLGHELLEDRELALLGRRLLLAAAVAERLRRLDALLPLALEHLQLLVVGERALQLLLGALERVDDQAERVAPLGVAREHRLLDLVLDRRDQAHAILPVSPPLSTCQCRWKIVCPAPAPAFTTTR